MVLFFQVIIGLILALIVYNLIHYLFVSRPTRKRLKMGQKVVDQAVNGVLPELVTKVDILPIRSQEIAKVWGRGVMAFEYEIAKDKTNLSADEFRQQLTTSLDEYGKHHHFESSAVKNDQSVFRLTDVWELEDKLHFDVAFMVNQTTIEYVEDLDRLT
ncbi:hypothetical protein PL11_000620 [Lentilactobacillus curieae]|uniref:Uncharacterized protein n=1 Tax=Lentilactobacillus curieae TaxID=1138822 RepID=A0A1S6QG10_9LACO|nr:hypothetical protein PL11_000620 [Lentilactobacillus curieae]